MKKFFLLFIAYFFLWTAHAQDSDVHQFLSKADENLKELNSLSYWVDYHMKYLSDDDTTQTKGICYLKNMPTDSMKTHHNILHLTHNWQQIYNGIDIVNISFRDSSALIVNTEMDGYGFIKGNSINNLIRSYLFADSVFIKKLNDSTLISAKFVNEKIIMGEKCLGVQFKYKDDGDVSNIVSTFYFRPSDYFPVGYHQTLNLLHEVQYRQYTLSNISTNQPQSSNLYDQEFNVPSYFKIENYVPQEREPLLSEGVIAPEFTLPSIDESTHQLTDKKGKILILDFWYRSCHPCVKALPELQKLSEKFVDADVEVIGINPYDKKEKIIAFLKELNIDYTNLYDARPVPNDYKVSAYPTLYIINKDGTIASSHIGFSETLLDDLSKEIEALLK